MINRKEEDVLNVIESLKPVRDAEKEFSAAAQRHKFGVLVTSPLFLGQI